MSPYYLRMEGVNLDNFVYDTKDLSTIRGGGLLLLETVDTVFTELEKIPGFHRITQGASWGMAAFEAENDIEAEKVAQAVREILNRGQAPTRHATFVVDAIPCSKNEYAKDRERLTAINRWQQMQAPSVAIPSAGRPFSVKKESGDKRIFACEYDRFRPASIVRPHKDKKQEEGFSASVDARRKHGKERKRNWYTDQTGIDLLGFVNDLDELTADNKGIYGNLNHKMAVIYLDGNHFGRLQQKICISEEKQHSFDKQLRIQYQKQQALGGLITAITKDGEAGYDRSHWFTREDGEKKPKIRLETLLWGGDEILWVVPAWLGWQVLGDFFSKWSADWEIEGKKLTHAGGLVFCHHNAPIHRIKNVAIQLADMAKKQCREKNLFAYQILESFDHAGGDLAAMRKKRLPDAIKEPELILDGNSMLNAAKLIQELKTLIPKRRLHKIIQSMNNTDQTEELLTRLEKECGFDDHNTPIQDLTNCLGSRYGGWLHLLELWDYIIDLGKGDNNHAAH